MKISNPIMFLKILGTSERCSRTSVICTYPVNNFIFYVLLMLFRLFYALRDLRVGNASCSHIRSVCLSETIKRLFRFQANLFLENLSKLCPTGTYPFQQLISQKNPFRFVSNADHTASRGGILSLNSVIKITSMVTGT